MNIETRIIIDTAVIIHEHSIQSRFRHIFVGVMGNECIRKPALQRSTY